MALGAAAGGFAAARVVEFSAVRPAAMAGWPAAAPAGRARRRCLDGADTEDQARNGTWVKPHKWNAMGGQPSAAAAPTITDDLLTRRIDRRAGAVETGRRTAGRPGRP